jgi:uncharacterized tellurite resistance protein B-like protein
MFETLSAFFTRSAPTPAPLPEPDAKLALGTLLVRVAKADHSYLFEEIETIDRILAGANGLNPVQAAMMRATCEKLADEVQDDLHMAHLIRESVDLETRSQHVEALWAVAHADGRTHASEVALVGKVAKALGLPKTPAPEL